jgi:myo-inositol-1-phosphate synthase
VGERYDTPTHKVHIDYYPPRGDAKEAWDVIDFTGIFGLPMSLRLNLQGRDSILAAPMVIDLARWAAA